MSETSSKQADIEAAKSILGFHFTYHDDDSWDAVPFMVEWLTQHGSLSMHAYRNGSSHATLAFSSGHREATGMGLNLPHSLALLVCEVDRVLRGKG